MTIYATYGADAASQQPTKAPVRAATAAALPACTYAGAAQTLTGDANGALAAVDGITMAAGQRLLVKNQSTGSNNGIYEVTQLGTAGTPFILTRAPDANASADLVPGMLVPVQEGDLNGDKTFQLLTNAAITLDTTALTFGAIAASLADADGLSPLETIWKAVAAAGGGAADDVTIYSANAPYKFRIIDVAFTTLAGAAGGRTVQLRDTAGGAGNTCSDAITAAATGLTRDAATTPARRTIAKGGTLVLRRSDSAVGGELLILIRREA